MRLVWTTLFLVVAATPLPSIQSKANSSAAQLVGTWRLMLYEDLENGRRVNRFGEKPLGLFIYTPDGHVAIQIADPSNPPCIPDRRTSDSRLPTCTPEQTRNVVDHYVAYWGTYTIDESAGVVVHHVQSDLGYSYIGTDQRRSFRLNGNRLILGDGPNGTRVLERVR